MNSAERGVKVLELLAQAYCTKENEKKILDNDLIVASAALLYPFIQSEINGVIQTMKDCCCAGCREECSGMELEK